MTQSGPVACHVGGSGGSRKVEKGGQPAPENFGKLIIHESHLYALRRRKTHEQREIPLPRLLTPSTNDDA